MIKPAFDTPLSLREVGYLPPEITEAPGAQLRRFGAATLLVRFGRRAAGWVKGEGDHRLVVDDGERAVRTAVVARWSWRPSLTRRGDAILAVAGEGDRFAEVAFEGGQVRSYAMIPGGRYEAIAELADGTLAALSEREERVVLFERDTTALRPRAAFGATEGSSLRSACGGRALLVGFEQTSVLEVWWVEGEAGPRVVARFEGLSGLCDFECATDETGDNFARPDEPMFWDGETGYVVEGFKALTAPGANLARFAPPPSAELPERPEGLAPPVLPTLVDAPAPPPAPPRPHLGSISSPYVRAFIEALSQGTTRDEADPGVSDLFAPNTPRELAWLLGAAAWYRVGHLSLGEYWFERPRAVSGRRALGRAREAVHIGVIANGDEVIARVSGGSLRIVELSHEEDAETDRGGLESFLRHCVAYAREHDEVTSIDPFLPENDRDGW